jgi:DNA-binding transcriptional MerR regulator
MAEVAPYVLRYWETEFPALAEGREKGGNARLYTARDVQIIARIRQLLYDEGFTVAGAKKRLEAEIQEGRFDEGGKKTAAAPPPEPRPRPVPAPVEAPPPPPPPPAAPARSAAPTSAAAAAKVVAPPPAAPSNDFPERRAVIKELKDIVRLLEKPKKH